MRSTRQLACAMQLLCIPLALIISGCVTSVSVTHAAVDRDELTTRAIVSSYLAAMDAGKASTASSLFASHATYEDKTYSFIITGVPAIRSMLESAVATLSPVDRKVVRETYDGPYATIEWTAEGRHAGPILGVPSTGKMLRVRAVSLIEVRDGRIQSVTDYTDRATLEAQLGR